MLRRLAVNDCEEFIVVNFANADMVGHTGSLPAAIKACETVDACVGAIVEATLKARGEFDRDGRPRERGADVGPDQQRPAHVAHDVRGAAVCRGGSIQGTKAPREGGRLADIAPTMLAMMGLNKPEEMTGESLLE